MLLKNNKLGNQDTTYLLAVLNQGILHITYCIYVVHVQFSLKIQTLHCEIRVKAIQERGRKLTLRNRYSTAKIDVNRFQTLLPLSIMNFRFLLWIFIFHVWNLKLKHTHTGIENTGSCPTKSHRTAFFVGRQMKPSSWILARERRHVPVMRTILMPAKGYLQELLLSLVGSSVGPLLVPLLNLLLILDLLILDIDS